MQTVPLPAFSILIYLYAACLLFFSAFSQLKSWHSLVAPVQEHTVTLMTSPQSLPLTTVNHLFSALLLHD